MFPLRWWSGIACLAGLAVGQVPTSEVPDLTKVELPILAVAKAQPEALWAFLVDPATPYRDALAAATRCADVLPFRFAEPLLRAREELHREDQLHGFGFEPPKVAAVLPERPADLPRERRILGRAWMVPAALAPYPTSWAAACEAPWPWRATEVLDRAWDAVIRGIGAPYVGGAERNRAWLQRVEAWYAECLRWPIDDDASALRFFEATSVPRHAKSLPVLARWRRILLDPRTPGAAMQIAYALGESHRQLLHGEPDARLACQILAGDGLRLSPHLQARWGCAYQLGRFTLVNDPEMRESRLPCPPEALLLVGDLGAAPPSSDANERWNQLYVHVYSVLEAVDRPPFAVDRSLGADRQDVAGLLAKFAAWWPEQRPQVEAQVSARAERVEQLRQQLEALAR